jgi:hypothetical protein
MARILLEYYLEKTVAFSMTSTLNQGVGRIMMDYSACEFLKVEIAERSQP